MFVVVIVVVVYIAMEYLRVESSPSDHVAARATRNDVFKVLVTRSKCRVLAGDSRGTPHMTAMPMIPNRYNLKASRVDKAFQHSIYS